ncbi:uncharacterized protein EI90DRAFT_3296135 [Cantharellus anzutake]|uniref:uncharacterized protein n=1 Tax=Cantharellus anzutake TaxID=1750568 RepID=UPI0019034829|nr:uncharacterized protein EI90DRAFT_3296135 [Cantharellus anzutake]KAF8310230.1 hypothetical protein EI90DRAFT_3296135 [Cantharellus anzutake]
MSALELCLEKKDYVVSRARLRLSNDYSVSSEGKVCCKCDVPNMATHFSGSLAVQNVLFSIIYGLIQSQIIYFGSYSNGLFIDVNPDTPLDSGGLSIGVKNSYKTGRSTLYAWARWPSGRVVLYYYRLYWCFNIIGLSVRTPEEYLHFFWAIALWSRCNAFKLNGPVATQGGCCNIK